MNVLHRILLTLIALSGLVLTTTAQSDGQFCMRAYEDRNANGERDPGEPLITQDVGASLQDARGVIIASRRLAESPTGAQGVLCFQNLAGGQYTMTVTSARYDATSEDTMTVMMTGDSLPVVFEYGGQLAYQPDRDSDETEVDREEALERLGFAAVGAFGAMLISALVGLVVYVILLRRVRRRFDTTASQEFDRTLT
jgi:hypothetical protein